jgi:hypothetical protein
MASPTARSLNLLRRSGYQAAVVERWNMHVGKGIRQDLWGFADLIACHPIRQEIVLVQVTTADHVAGRLAKAKQHPQLAAWLRSGGRFAVHGWGKRSGKPEARIVEVLAQDLADVVIQKLARRGRRPRQPDLFDAG